VVAAYRLRDSDVRIVLRHGGADIWTFNELFELALYEPPIVVRDMLRKRPSPLRVLDLGANVGLYGALIRRAEPRASMVAFEPDPTNRALLEACIALNAREGDWTLVPACAATSDGTVAFSATGDPESRAVDLPPTADVVTVEKRDVFPYVDGVDLLKMDIEGGEWELISDERFGGALAVVLEYHPFGCPGEDPHREADRFLEAAGYRIIPVYRSPDGHGMVWAWRSASP